MLQLLLLLLYIATRDKRCWLKNYGARLQCLVDSTILSRLCSVPTKWSDVWQLIAGPKSRGFGAENVQLIIVSVPFDFVKLQQMLQWDFCTKYDSVATCQLKLINWIFFVFCKRVTYLRPLLLPVTCLCVLSEWLSVFSDCFFYLSVKVKYKFQLILGPT